MNRVGGTHLMLRIALMGTAAAIVISVAFEIERRRCSLTSISAFWYTDARAVFAGGLVALGVCLVAYAGGTWTENLLLNLAGILAPVVAFAPTRVAKSKDLECLGFVPTYDKLATDNGLFVYFVCLLGGVVVAAATSRSLRGRLGNLSPTQKRASKIGLMFGAAIPVAMLIWRFLDSEFALHVHFPAAVLMFVFLAGVVALRIDKLSAWSAKWDPYRDDDLRRGVGDARTFPYSPTYALLAGVMLGALVVAPISIKLELWAYTVIVAEFVLLVAFLIFWLLQTIQLRGFRSDGEEAQADSDVRTLA